MTSASRAVGSRALSSRLVPSGPAAYLTRLALSAAAALCVSVGGVWAQQPDNKGTEFWLMFNSNLAGAGENVDLLITGDVATVGLVEIPGLEFSREFSVTPGAVTTVDLPVAVRVNGSDNVENKGVHIVAEAEVTVYGLNQRDATTDAFLGLPVDILGTEYISLGYENTNDTSGTQFGIVATADDTTVTITPTETTDARPAGEAYEVIMNTGEAYQLRNESPAPADLTGSIITADRPIAVFAGHRCANVPAGRAACDHLVEQIPPVSTWGQSFVTFPLATRLNGDTFRVLASEDATAISINGANFATLNRGEYLETILTAASTVNADKPVLVAQYSNSTSFDGVISDPFEAIVPPTEQFLESHVVSTPASQIGANFINIVAPDAAVGSITLDGAVISADEFEAIGDSGFSGTAQAVEIGSHTIDGPLAVGVISYGFDAFDSYGYPGGLALAELARLTSLELAPATASNPVDTEDCVIATAADQNNEPLSGLRVVFETTGANLFSSAAFTQADGGAEFCYTGANVGSDTITAASGGLTATATKEWTAATVIARCDVDGNGQIDSADIGAIAERRNTPATGPDDPADADGNGIIDVNDGRQCALRCTNSQCAPSPAMQEEEVR